MYSMNAIGKFISNFRDFYNEINAATLTGAIDVIVVEQPDGSFTCSPFHVRFGKLGVLRSREKVVDIEINGEPLDIHMKLGDSGEAFFVEEVAPEDLGEDGFIPPHLACSPIPHDDNCFPLERHESDDQESRSLEQEFKSSQGDLLSQSGNKDEHQDEQVVPSTENSSISIGEISVDSQTSGISDSPSQQSVPKTFCAETVDEDTKLNEKVRKISIANGEFRPISFEADSEVTNSDAGQQPEDSSAVEGIDDENEQSSLSRKESFKDSTSTDGGMKRTSSSAKRKKRRKSLMKRKAGQKKGNGGSNIQGELLEQTDGSKESQKENVEEGEGIFQQGNETKTAEEGIQGPAITVTACETSVTVTEPMVSSVENLAELSRIQHASTETDFHFFSDTEVTPGCTPPDSRPSSPVQSDTEFEMNRQSKAVGTEDEEPHKDIHGQVQQSWRWGELPSPLPRPVMSSQKSITTKEISETEPISSSDEEINKKKTEEPTGRLGDEEDAESGNGTSLPQSPHSVEGAIGGPKSVDSDFEEPKHTIFEMKSYGEISLSLCGGLAEAVPPNEDTFLQNLVTYNDVVQDPKLVENPNLVVRLNGKYYNWRTACPLVMSLVAFQKPLPQQVVDTLYNEYMPLKKGQKKDVAKQSSYSSWFYWRRASEPKKETAGQEELSSPESEKIIEIKEADEADLQQERELSVDSQVKPPLRSLGSVEIEIEKAKELDKQSDQTTIVEIDESDVPSQINFAQHTEEQKEAKEEGYSGSNSSEDSDSGHPKTQGVKIPIERRSYYDNMDRFRKTLRLSSDQIARLNLNEGGNEVVFSVTTAYQGTTRCKCHIYRWRYDDKVVISDIDGTITKSDVLGHILPIVGKDWAQSGVAQLFTKIKDNGYKLLYLSARAIGQARVTREYLKSIKQGDLSLPDGPLLLNPTSLLSAFHREVIEKKPEEFKISCLRDIQALFPEDSKPFYAGYGNRINDVWAYRAVGIPIFRIFTINHRGELKHELTQTFQSSYSNMSYIVDQMFPPPPEDTSEDFTNFVYWRDPIPDIDVDLQGLLEGHGLPGSLVTGSPVS